MSGRDIIGVAKTGSGKTLAYLLPMLRHVMDQRPVAQGEVGLIRFNCVLFLCCRIIGGTSRWGKSDYCYVASFSLVSYRDQSREYRVFRYFTVLLASSLLSQGPIALIMAPSRELVTQIFSEARKLARVVNLRAAVVYGGSPIAEQIAELKRGAEIVVCTPGRMIELLAMREGTLLR